jgi:hypothetical protein
MDIFLSGGGDDVIVVRHEDDVMDENLIFFNTFRDCLKSDSRGFLLIEPKGLVVGSANQVVRVRGLYNTEWASHVMDRAQGVPKDSDTDISRVCQKTLTPISEYS